MVERPSYRGSLFATRPFTRLRRLLGRHRTLWRIGSGAAAIIVSFSLPSEHSAPAPIAAAQASPFTVIPAGSVGVAIPRTVPLPRLELGDLVHAVVVTDPLVVGEERATEIVIRDAAVIDLDEMVVTISVGEQSAIALVDAIAKGSVVLILSG